MGNWDNHCPNCFTDKPAGNRQCQHCGYDEKTSRSPAALPVRTILHDQFVVGRVLGNPGGFGITYLCWDIKLRMRVAIKEFMPRDNAVRDTDRCSVVAHSGKDQEFFEYGLNAFLAEAQTVAGFNHPNIVRVRTYFEQNHTAYLVMDYYEGVSLAEYVKQQGGSLPEKAALGIMGFVLDGLRHVHDGGYLHRDIKPANIYLTGKGQVILLDFGAARYAIGEHSRSLSVVVTPGFSPFEQYSTKGAQGPWTDIYAVGATLYFMLTGQPPDSAPDRMISDTLMETVQQEPRLSPGVKQWIIRSMQVKASDRLQTVTDFGAALRECQQSITQPKPVTQNQSSLPRQQEIPPKKDVISQPENAIRHNSKREQNISEKEDVPIDKDKSDGEQKPVVSFWRKKAVIALGVSLLIVVSYIINMDTWTNPVPGMVFMWVPGGCYQMGCGAWTSDCGSDESPVHEVCVDGFWIAQNEVTQGQWMKVMESNPSGYKKGGNYPVENVSWEDAKEYIRRLNGKGGAKFRLPSEAEWEYAARSGGKPEHYLGGNDVDAVAWYGSNSSGSTHPVKTKKANGLGLYDMSGNVWEWCEDAYISDIYGKSANSKNPVYTSGGSNRVIRGGGWFYAPNGVRCANRGFSDPAFRYDYVGFRLLRMP